jgi:ABC-2 type transport system ATP-binding protein
MARLRVNLLERRGSAERTVPPSARDVDAVRTSGLTKAFGKHLALDGVDLRVPPGVVFGYLGPNGAGKSTTIRVLCGLIRPTSGDVEVLGQDVVRDRDAAQRLIGYLPGGFVAYPDLTGAQYLHHLTCLRDSAGEEVFPALAERLELPLDRRIGTLSHGNRQKVGIVQAFMHEPSLLVLDEPTTGLDPLGQREFLAMVREVRESGRTVFLSSHVLSEVEAVADVVGILRRGQLVVTDTIGNLEQQAVRRIDLVFAGTPPDESLRRVPGVREVVVADRTVHVRVEGSTASLLRVAAPYDVDNVITHEADLGEVFLGWYESEDEH